MYNTPGTIWALKLNSTGSGQNKYCRPLENSLCCFKFQYWWSLVASWVWPLPLVLYLLLSISSWVTTRGLVGTKNECSWKQCCWHGFWWQCRLIPRGQWQISLQSRQYNSKCQSQVQCLQGLQAIPVRDQKWTLPKAAPNHTKLTNNQKTIKWKKRWGKSFVTEPLIWYKNFAGPEKLFCMIFFSKDKVCAATAAWKKAYLK